MCHGFEKHAPVNIITFMSIKIQDRGAAKTLHFCARGSADVAFSKAPNRSVASWSLTPRGELTSVHPQACPTMSSLVPSFPSSLALAFC